MKLALPRQRQQRTVMLGDYLTLFEDQFNGPAVNTNIWTVTDTESKVTVSTGALRFSGGRATPAWGDPRVAKTVSFRRRAGLTFECELTKPTVSQDGPLAGFTSALADSYADDGFYFVTSAVQFAVNGGTIGLTQSLTNSTSYRIRLVLKATGFLAYFSDDGGLTWDLLWENSTDSTNPIFAMISNYSAVSLSHDYARVRQTPVKADVVNDTFTRADSATTMGNAETGQAWSALNGTWGISTNKAYLTDTAEAVYAATLDAGIGDGLVDCTIRDSAWAVGKYGGVAFRVTSVSQLLAVLIEAAEFSIFKRVAAAWTQLATAAFSPANDTDYAVRVGMLGNQIRAWRDGTLIVSYTLAGDETTQFANTITSHGLVGSGGNLNTVRWDGFRVQGGLV